MKSIAGWMLSFIFLGLGISIPANQEDGIVGKDSQALVALSSLQPLVSIAPEANISATRATVIVEDNRVMHQEITFVWGDISWLSKLASEAGWPEDTHERLGEIILRESGGCPNRRGGDKVDKYCNLTGVSEWNHRSDTGLLQINGVNWDLKRNKWAIACRQMNICTQKPLLNPLTNLEVGYLLYREAGWGPWDPCAWGPDYADRCKSTHKQNKP